MQSKIILKYRIWYVSFPVIDENIPDEYSGIENEMSSIIKNYLV